jgi:hypothetical protein
VRKLIESTFVTLGGDISAPQEWGAAFLSGADAEAHAHGLLFGAGALLLGRKTYEGLSAGYLAMAVGDPESVPEFVATMNAIPKHVASTTLTDLGWNATLLGPDVAAEVAALKQQPGRYLLKYGTDPGQRGQPADDLGHGLAARPGWHQRVDDLAIGADKGNPLQYVDDGGTDPKRARGRPRRRLPQRSYQPVETSDS